MKVDNVILDKTVVSSKDFPCENLPEIAFVGKSNVGKSSLINSMVYRKAIARTSGQPGKTRTINFYLVENKLYFVDLPGYGYAKVSKVEKEKWGKMIEGYLKNRLPLKAAVLIIDIRHEPSANDKMMYDWFKHYGHRLIICASKSDKIKRSKIESHISAIRKSLGSNDIIVPFSNETKEGRDSLWAQLESIVFCGDAGGR